MKRPSFMLLSFALIVAWSQSAWSQSKAAAGFEKLKSLAGEWQGAGADGKMRTVTYQLLSGGTAAMETLTPADEPSMVSVYYVDGDRLMMTHFCSAGNQPRLRAALPAGEGEIRKLDFDFLDATNLAKPTAGHIHRLSLAFQDQNHLSQTWTWWEEGKEMVDTFHLTRKK
jgi:hypothetical protein